jgi:hypothetical protein
MPSRSTATTCFHYEFTWAGNEREARAVINHLEAATVGHGLKPGNIAHGTLHRLNEILANIVDPSEDDRAALLSYAFRLAVIENPSRGDHGRTVLQRLALGKGLHHLHQGATQWRRAGSGSATCRR